MKTSCLINNYNYGRFVCDAVSSALAQTVPFDEVIVVDDGSTDDSLARLRDAFAGNSRVRIVSKANGGQLSAFNAGFAEATGDILFFLDADDRYKPGLVEEVMRVYSGHSDCCMVLIPMQFIDKRGGIGFVHTDMYLGPEDLPDISPDSPAFPALAEDGSFPKGRSDMFVFERWAYAPTSAISIRRKAASRFMPLHCEREWRVCADDCLLTGVASFNFPRRYLHKVLAEYRIHGENAFAGVEETPERKMERKNARRILFEELAMKSSWPRAPEAMAAEVVSDRSEGPVSRRNFRNGWRALERIGLPWHGKWAWRMRLLGAWLRHGSAAGGS